MRRRLLAGLVTATLVAAMSGCGVGPQEQARPVDDADVPFGLLDPEVSPPLTTAPTGTLVRIHLVAEDDTLVPVERRTADTDLADMVALLVGGPSDEETQLGLRSVLASAGDAPDLLGAVELARGVATVDLDEAFAELASDAQLLAIGQIVLTLTDRPGVGQVSFTLAGSPVDVPRGDGTTASGTVTRGDYRDLAAPTP